MSSSVLLAFLRRDAFVNLSYRAGLALNAVSVLCSVATFFFMSRLVAASASPALAAYGGDYFPFVLIGLAFSTFQSVALKSFAQCLRQEQALGTLEPLLASPASLPLLLLGGAQWEFGWAALETLLFLGAGAVLGGLSFPAANIPAALLLALLTVTSCLSLGVLSAAFILRWKRGDPVAWVAGSVSELLAGVYFPVSLLPDWLGSVAALIPMTHSLEGLRKTLIGGATLAEVAPSVAALAVFSGALFPLGLLMLRSALDATRRTGSLGHY